MELSNENLQATVQRLQSKSSFNEENNESTESTIPKVIYVTHKYNLCDLTLSSGEIASRKQQIPHYEALALNVQRIKEYNPEHQVICYDDEMAMKYIKSKDVELSRDFEMEPHGMFKADLFRIVILYHEGGYYMDCDMEPIVGLSQVQREDATFMSAIDFYGENVFQSFLAAAKGSPVLKDNLDIFKRHYAERNSVEDVDSVEFVDNLGTVFMGRALLQFTGESTLQDIGREYGEERIYLFHEKREGDQWRRKWKYEMRIYDDDRQQFIFWSRIVGYHNEFYGTRN